MLELDVAFDFTCQNCGDPLGVTLRCTGEGLAAGKNALASVKVPCPNCQEINHLFFTPDGATLHQVTLDRSALLMPEPSFN